jgi:hypothetical protein
MKVVHRSIAYVASMITMLIANFVKGFHVIVQNMIMEKGHVHNLFINIMPLYLHDTRRIKLKPNID